MLQIMVRLVLQAEQLLLINRQRLSVDGGVLQEVVRVGVSHHFLNVVLDVINRLLVPVGGL